MLTSQQLNEVLTIIHTNQAILTGQQFGLEFLSEYDKSLLVNEGVDWQTLYSTDSDSIYQSFHFGMLAQALQDTKSLSKFTYKDLKDYISQGKYIPITEREKLTIQAVKLQSLADIKASNGRIFQDLNNILISGTRKEQERFIQDEIATGIEEKKSLREIANTISEKTGDWVRDFDRIVEYQANSAYQHGRAAFIQKNNEDQDPDVYKLVLESACKHCLSLYTTAGFQSEPKIFKLSELRANGTNIGRKVADWKPIIDSTHPFCRCNLYEKRKGYKWNKESQLFDIKDETVQILKKPRLPIRATIGGKEVLL